MHTMQSQRVVTGRGSTRSETQGAVDIVVAWHTAPTPVLLLRATTISVLYFNPVPYPVPFCPIRPVSRASLSSYVGCSAAQSHSAHRRKQPDDASNPGRPKPRKHGAYHKVALFQSRGSGRTVALYSDCRHPYRPEATPCGTCRPSRQDTVGRSTSLHPARSCD
jgi:hypothetical protein